jgi:hypothetical protein
LAVRLAPEYQIQAGPDIERMAFTSLKALHRTNVRIPTLNIDPALKGAQGPGYIVWSDGSR